MTTGQNTESAALTTTGIVALITGAATVTFALFPLAIPFLLLTAVFTAPLALIGVGAAIPLGVIAIIVLAIRAIGRRLGSRASPAPAAPGAPRRSATASRAVAGSG